MANAVRGEGRIHHRRGEGAGPLARGPVRRRGRRHHRVRPMRADATAWPIRWPRPRISTRRSTSSRRPAAASSPSRATSATSSGCKAAVANGVAELGRDRLRARQRGDTAGRRRGHATRSARYVDAVDVLLNGVYFTIEAALPAHVGARGRRRHRDHQFDGGAQRRCAHGFSTAEPRRGRLSSRQARRRRPDAILTQQRWRRRTFASTPCIPSGVATPMMLNETIEQFFGEHPEALARTAEPVGRPADRAGRHQRRDGLPVRRSPVGTSPASRCRSTAGCGIRNSQADLAVAAQGLLAFGAWSTIGSG